MTDFNSLTASPTAVANMADADRIVIGNPDVPGSHYVTTLALLAEKLRLLQAAAVSITAAGALSQTANGGKMNVLNSAAGIALTLPLATGTGTRFEITVGTTITSGTTTITCAGSDKMGGVAVTSQDGGNTVQAFEALIASTTILTMDGSTRGGIVGDKITFVDVGAAKWAVTMIAAATGSEVSPFN